MKAEIGIVGHFGYEKEFYDGQTIKTKILHDEIKKRLGNDQVLYTDTNNWNKNMIRTFFSSLRLAAKSKKIIINTSNRGRNLFIPFFYLLSFFLKIKVYCLAIGGGFPKQMKKNKFVSFFAEKIDGVFVETNTMLNELHALRYNNVYQLNNFKDLDIIKEKNLVYKLNQPLRICTFSRILKEKGIEDIIEAVTEINEREKKSIYFLDIYGRIDSKYKKKFEELERGFPEYIKYKGIIDYDKSVETIKDYFLLIFPTLYKTEGIPGTIIDAYASGVPVIASNWDSHKDVIINNETGMIYEMGNIDDLINKLTYASQNISKINEWKRNCLNKSKEYSAEKVIIHLLQKTNDEYDVDLINSFE